MGVKKTHLDVRLLQVETLKIKLLCNFRGIQCVGQILLVREDKEKRIMAELLENPVQRLLCLGDTTSIVRVYDKDNYLRVRSVYKFFIFFKESWVSTCLSLTLLLIRLELVLHNDLEKDDSNVLIFCTLDSETLIRRWRHYVSGRISDMHVPVVGVVEVVSLRSSLLRLVDLPAPERPVFIRWC
jgi:hypothetical protein